MSDESIKRISRHQVLGIVVAAVVSAIISGAEPTVVAQGRGQAAAPAEELVLVNGRIHTVDAKNTITS